MSSRLVRGDLKRHFLTVRFITFYFVYRVYTLCYRPLSVVKVKHSELDQKDRTFLPEEYSYLTRISPSSTDFCALVKWLTVTEPLF